MQRKTLRSILWITIILVALALFATKVASALSIFNVQQGGTGVGTITGIIKGNGTSAFSGLTGTSNQITYWSDANTIASLTTATYPSLTELSYVKGVTSAIQTQLNAKESALTFSTGLTRATNTITSDISTGISGGQTIIGSTSTNSGLTIKSTTGVGTTGADIIFKVGNNGATEAGRVLNSGVLQLGASGGANGKITFLRNSDGTEMGNIQQSSYLSVQGANGVSLGVSTTNGLLHAANGTWMGKGSISNSAPTALVNIAAGTATASTAPLKFTAGTNLATTEAGAVEFDGSHLYFTAANAGTRYQLDQPTVLGTVTTGVWNGTAIANANLANSTISGIALGGTLGALTATDTSLTFSGSYTGATARTVGLNLANANTWTGKQTFNTSAPRFGTITGSTQCLHVDTNGDISGTGSDCGSGGGGATTALDNLASVAINTSLISDTDNTDDLGSALKEWKDLYVDGTAYVDAIDLNGTALTSTGTQLNYLSSATGTTGTTSTNLVFSTSPSLITPTLGVASATSINKVAITAPATSATLTIADGKTLTISNSITLAGTDSTVMTFPTTSATIARTDAANTFTGASTASAWVLTSPTITTKISPTTDDGAPLGDTTHNFSDLFLASGAVLNYANSDVVLTHSTGILTLGTGTLKITTPTNTSTSVVTIDGTQTLTNKSIAIGQITGLGTGVGTWLATPSSANLLAAITDETGTGLAVFGTAPTFASTMTIGTASGTTGAINFKGTTSGTLTLTTAAAAGTWTMTLPTTGGSSGQFLQTNGSGTTTWATPSGASAVTVTPLPNFNESHLTSSDTAVNDTYNTTTMQIGQVVIPFAITANKISFYVNTRNATGTHDLTLYAEDGQSQIFSVTTAAIAGSAVVTTTALSSVVIPAGVYWIGINPNSTASINFPVYRSADAGVATGVTSEPVLSGRLTITSGTPPATFTPSSVTYDNISTLQFRLDN